MGNISWNEVKQEGNPKYNARNGGVEPIDLFYSGEMLQDFALANIIKYAYRNRRAIGAPSVEDMYKIIHYAKMIIAMTPVRKE